MNELHVNEAYRWLLAAHGLSGLGALLTYWIAAFAKKGARLHVRAGQVYLFAMLGIIVTAVPMAIMVWMSGKPVIATFLAYLVVITATSLWRGRRALNLKRDQDAFRGGLYPFVALTNLVVSVTVFAIGSTLRRRC